MTAKIAGVTPVVFFIAAFVVGAVILLAYAVRPQGLWRRQRYARRATVGYRRRPNADLGIRPVRALFSVLLGCC